MTRKTVEQKVESALLYLEDKHYARFAISYGEPGYSDPENGIIFANWNNVPKGLADWLESKGYALEWSDEWTEVDDKAYRTSPDSYQWESSLILTNDGEYLTRDDSASAIIDELAMSDRSHPIGCVPSWITAEEIIETGFTLYAGELESGHHGGQHDDPQTIARKAFAEGAARVIFRKVENSQFYVRFECYVENEE